MIQLSKQAVPFSFFLAFIIAAMLSGCAGHKKGAVEPVKTVFGKDSLKGYLPAKALPDSIALLPPPPKAGSVAYALDEEFSKKSLALRDTPAWALAKLDADKSFPNAAGTFSCALNAPVNEQDTPRLYALLRRTLSDAGASTDAAKKQYQRPRPFIVNQQPTCTPEEQERMAKEGSYPSKHNAVGMAWALIFAEISPEQADAVLARGQAYGLSRMICNAHWHSDTLNGRYLGAYTLAVLHSDPEFRDDLEAAGDELKAVRAKGLKPTRDCQAEKSGMDLQQSLYR